MYCWAYNTNVIKYLTGQMRWVRAKLYHNSFILTLETLHKKPHWRCFPSFWSCAHCLRRHPPQNHPGFVGNFGCSWGVVKSCDPSPGPPEENGVIKQEHPDPTEASLRAWPDEKWLCTSDFFVGNTRLWSPHFSIS